MNEVVLPLAAAAVGHVSGARRILDAPPALLDLLPMAIYACDAGGRVRWCNRRAVELWGRMPRIGEDEELYCGSHRLYLLDGERLPHNKTPMAHVLQTGEPAHGKEVVVERPDGSRIVVLVNIDPIKDEDGALLGAVNCFQDISDFHQVNEELRRRQQDLEDFFENGAVGLHLVASDGTILRANKAELDLLGYTADEYLGRHIAEFHADQHVIEDILARLKRGEKLEKYPARLRAKDGSIRHVLITSNVQFREGAFINTRCFTFDITESKRAQEQVAESEERFRQLLEALPAAVYTTDAEGRITFYNQAAAELAGRRPVLGQDQWCVSWQLRRPDGTLLPHDECPMATALKENRPIRGVEVIVERPDGTRIAFLPYPTPLHDASGRLIGAVNMLVDIAERKRTEERQRLLMAELDHRVKNLLAVFQSLVGQTRRNAETLDGFASGLEGRVRAMARTHGLLAQSRWEGARLRRIVEDELQPYQAEAGERAVATGPDLLLRPRAAQALSMAIHELATNAAKHGALSVPGGRIEVWWDLLEAEDEARLVLHWSERGGPRVEAPTRRGFGCTLIERSLAYELDGEARLDFSPDGVVCRIAVPAESVERPFNDNDPDRNLHTALA